MDYVSHVILEYNFSQSSFDNNHFFENILLENLVANHLLNLSCTMADAGLVSAIL